MSALVGVVMDPGWSRSQLSQALADPLGRIRLAESAASGESEDRLLGFVIARRILDILEIDLVGVRSGARQRGIAKGLLRALLEAEGESGLAEARLELAATNAPARRLYEGLGFVVVGTRSRYYPSGDDALLLSHTQFEPTPPGSPEMKERSARMSAAVESDRAPMRGRARVLSNEVEGSGRKLLLAVPGWSGSQPGQFAMVGAGAEAGVPRWDPLLPRPMAVYRDLASAEGSEGRRVELLYRVVGRGTSLLAEAEPGDSISIVGPLGRGFPLEAGDGPAILVGGGSGIASLYELARALIGAGRSVLVILGARSAIDLLGRRDFEALDLELVCTTEDGSVGVHGRVIDPLAGRLAEAAGRATVYAVGPTPMMKACADLAGSHSTPCWVSLENPMACGFGVCLGCAAPRAEGGFALVCRAGPVFDARALDWAGLS